jgi:quinol monooxygenase YgiN
MLIVAGEVRIEAGAAEQVLDALRAMESATRAEPGCLAYAFSIDVDDPTMLRIFERWESQDALKAHFGTPHMAAFGAAVAAVQPKSVEIKAYEIASEVPLPS